MLGTVALDASLGLILESGIDHIENTVLSNTAHLLAELGKINGIELLTPREDYRHAGIVTFRHEHTPAEDIYRAMMQAGMVCAARGGGVRLSPHFHTSEQQLENTLRWIGDFVGK